MFIDFVITLAKRVYWSYCLIWQSSLILDHLCEQSKELGNQLDARRSKPSLIITSYVSYIHAQCQVQKYKGKVRRGNTAEAQHIYWSIAIDVKINLQSSILTDVEYLVVLILFTIFARQLKHTSLLESRAGAIRGNQTIPVSSSWMMLGW